MKAMRKEVWFSLSQPHSLLSAEAWTHPIATERASDPCLHKGHPTPTSDPNSEEGHVAHLPPRGACWEAVSGVPMAQDCPAEGRPPFLVWLQASSQAEEASLRDCAEVSSRNLGR